MQKTILMIVAVALVGCASPTTENRTPPVVSTPKVVPNSHKAAAAIETAIRKAANKPTGELTKADLEKVTRLSLGGLTTPDLSPLVKLTQLKWLSLNSNKLADLSHLVGLTQLEELYFGNNKLTDLSPLVKLTQLKGLYLGGNQLTDLSPLARLTQLQTLYVDGNNNLTYAEIEKLQKALPKCKIYSNPTK